MVPEGGRGGTIKDPRYFLIGKFHTVMVTDYTGTRDIREALECTLHPHNLGMKVREGTPVVAVENPQINVVSIHKGHYLTTL